MQRLFLLLALAAAWAVVLPAGVQAKTLRMAYAAAPASLDPHAELSAGTLQLSHLVFDPLVRWTRKLTFEPRLAERWERLNATTVRFYLRRGVTFHSGNPMTARDVVWTIDRLKRSPGFKTLFAPLAAARAIDEHTVDLVTAKPYPLVLNLATLVFPMDSAFYSGVDAGGRPKDDQGGSFAAANASGTGPFAVLAREPGVRVEFARFDRYWDRASPGNVGRIVLTSIGEGPKRVAALLSGEVDFIAPVPPASLARIRGDDRLSLVTKTGTRIVTLQLNQKRVPQFKDRRIRQAIAHAVDNAAIAKEVMGGFATPAGQLSPRGFAGHNSALTPRYDLRQARDLMKEAGYEFGFSVTMMAPSNRYLNDDKIARAVAAMLAKINIEVSLKTLPEDRYRTKLDTRAADVMMVGWQSDTEDSASFSEVLAMTPDEITGVGRYNAGNYSNPTVDRLLQQSRSMTDLKGRAEILREIERTLYEDAAFVPLHWQHLAWAARKGVHIERVVNVMNLPYLGDLVID